MAGPTVGYASLQIIPSMRGAQAAMAGQIAGPSAAVGKQAGGTMGSAMGAALKVGLGAAVTGLAAVAGLAKLGGSFDEAFDAIRVGTGATGDALEDLKGSFKTVFSSAPTDMASASQAVADLNTRLGLTGKPLEEMSTQLLELSRITGTDLGSNIEAVTRVFGDWGVAAEEQAGHLDALFRASQATGITVDTLGQQMVKYGAPLRQLGFDFDTTAGLLGKFEKEGVNAELVMGSMRIALGKMAREGIPAEEGLRTVVDQIANAGSASEANALALELFGARAGPDMAAAIREGRFDLGELYDTIATGEETILGAAEDTKDFGERWSELKNQALVGIEPLATRVFDALSAGMEWLSDWWSANGENVLGFFRNVGEAIGAITSAGLEAISNWWETNGETVTGAISTAFEAIKTAVEEYAWPAIQSMVEWIGDNEYILTGLATLVGVVLVGAIAAYSVAAWNAAAATVIATWPFLLLAVAIVGLVAATVWLTEKFNVELTGAVQWVIDRFAGFLDIVDRLVAAFKQAWEWAKKVVEASAKIPGLGGGGSLPFLGPFDPTRGVPFVPFLDDGGVMPGTRGVHSLAWVAGGETVLPTHKQDYQPGIGTGGGDITIQVTEVAGEPHGVTAVRELRRLQLLAVT